MFPELDELGAEEMARAEARYWDEEYRRLKYAQWLEQEQERWAEENDDEDFDL